MKKKVLVYLGATIPLESSYTEAVQQLGVGLAERGMTLVFGGSKEGTMAILAEAVLQHGGEAVGVFTKALPAHFLYEGLTQTLMTADILERKRVMFEQADAIVAMPGSYGTWDELFDALEQVKIAKMHHGTVKPIAVLNLHGYYDGIVQLLQRSVQEGYTTPHFADLLYSAQSVPELLEWLDA